MNNYCVYKITSPSGKAYIGITGQDPEKRWRRGLGYTEQRYMSRAIEKYGWENLKHEVLLSGLTREEAAAKEVELIASHKSDQREFGYNIAKGGFCGALSEETKKRLSEYNKGKKLSEAHRRKMSASLMGHAVSNETREKLRERATGKKASLEARANMSKARKGYKHPPEVIEKWRKSYEDRMNPVYQVDVKTKNIIACFQSSADAARSTGIDASTIAKCCKGLRKTAGGFKWSYHKF